MPLLVAFLAVMFSASVFAQQRVVDSNANAWLMYFGDHPVSENWGVHLEGQWRRHDLFSQWQQLFLRPAINYNLTDAVTLTAGYAFADTYPYGEFPAPARFPEHRLFQQAVVRHGVSNRLNLSHRYRLEQRFIGAALADADDSDRDYRYENRFRYQLRATTPLGDRDAEWYLAFYNEIFVNFGKNVAANVFDQNRAYGALGRKTGKWGNVEVGYLNQLVQQRSGLVLESNHTLQIAWFSTTPFN